MGLAAEGKVVVEMFAREDGGTYTILLISANGVACLLLEGEAWSDIPFVAPVRFRGRGI